MTGWEEADRKANAGDFMAMILFVEDAWKRSNEKKLASEVRPSPK